MTSMMRVGLPPHRKPIPIVGAFDRIGTAGLAIDPDKVLAIVLTSAGDRNSKFAEPDDVSKRIAAQVIDFLDHEVKAGRLPKSLLPLQSGVGNVANAVMAGLLDAPFDDLEGYTEVLQDGMLDLILAKNENRFCHRLCHLVQMHWHALTKILSF